MIQGQGHTIGSKAGTVSFIFAIFFLNMLSRLGLAPLLPGIQREMLLRHSEAGSLFLVPSFIGFAGDSDSFGWGVAALGIMTLIGFFLIQFVRTG